MVNNKSIQNNKQVDHPLKFYSSGGVLSATLTLDFAVVGRKSLCYDTRNFNL